MHSDDVGNSQKTKKKKDDRGVILDYALYDANTTPVQAPVQVPVQPTTPVQLPVQPTPVPVPVQPTTPVQVPVQPTTPVQVPVQPITFVEAPVQPTTPVQVTVQPSPVEAPVHPTPPDVSRETALLTTLQLMTDAFQQLEKRTIAIEQNVKLIVVHLNAQKSQCPNSNNIQPTIDNLSFSFLDHISTECHELLDSTCSVAQLQPSTDTQLQCTESDTQPQQSMDRVITTVLPIPPTNG